MFRSFWGIIPRKFFKDCWDFMTSFIENMVMTINILTEEATKVWKLDLKGSQALFHQKSQAGHFGVYAFYYESLLDMAMKEHRGV